MATRAGHPRNTGCFCPSVPGLERALLLCVVLVIFSGCGKAYFEQYDKAVVGDIRPDGPGIVPDDFSRRLGREVGQLIGKRGLLLDGGKTPLDDGTLVITGRVGREGAQRGVYGSYAFKTIRGAPICRAVFTAPDGKTSTEELSFQAASVTKLLCHLKNSSEPAPEGVWEMDSSPGRILLSLEAAALIPGPGRIGQGDGAPTYREAFKRGRSWALGAGLGLNGFATLFIRAGGMEFEGERVRSQSLALKLEDLRAWGIRGGISTRIPLSGGDPPATLWRFFPPFPDTHGIWLTGSLSVGLRWNSTLEGTIVAVDDQLVPAPPLGGEIPFYRSGASLFGECTAGVAFRFQGPGGGSLDFRIEAGIQGGEPWDEGGGAASEGDLFIVIPIRMIFSLAL